MSKQAPEEQLDSSTSPAVDRTFRFLRLQFGLFLFGLAIATMLEASIGLDPWSSFHEGLSVKSGLSFGRITQAIGLGLIVISWFAFRVRPGLGTLCNMAFVGPWVDLTRQQTLVPWFPGGVSGVVQFLLAVGVLGLATALYLGAGFGAGPRDGFVMGLSRRIGRTLRVTRIGLELVVLLCGFLLGGPIGLGTVLFALTMGPTMQGALSVFGVSHDPSPRRSAAAARG